MKVLRVLSCIAGCLLLCASFAFGTIHRSTSTIATEVIINQLIDEMSEAALSKLNDVTSFLPKQVQDQVSDTIMDALPAETKEQINQVKDELLQDKTIQSLSNSYMDAVLAGIVSGHTEGLPDVNNDVSDLAQTYVPKIAEAAGVPVTEAQLDTITNQIKERIDLNEVVTKTVSELNTALSPAQKQALSMIQLIQGNEIMMTSYVCLFIALALLVFGTRSAVKWMLYGGTCALLSGLVFLGGSKLIELLIGGRLSQLGTAFSSACDSVFAGLTTNGIWLCAIGVMLFILYAIIQFVRKHVVYE